MSDTFDHHGKSTDRGDSDAFTPASTGNTTSGASGKVTSGTGFKPQQQQQPQQQNGMVKVQPARLDDLQPSYARVLSPETVAPAHSWYSSMSRSRFHCYYCYCVLRVYFSSILNHTNQSIIYV